MTRAVTYETDEDSLADSVKKGKKAKIPQARLSPVLSPALKSNAQDYNHLRNYFNQAQSGFRLLFETPESQIDPQRLKANKEAWQAFEQACQEQLPVYEGDITLRCWLNMSSIFLPQPFERFEQSLCKIHQVLLTSLDVLERPHVQDHVKGNAQDNVKNSVKAKNHEQCQNDDQEDSLKAGQILSYCQQTLLQWCGESRNSGQLTRFLSYLPLTNDKRFYHYLNAKQYGYLPQLQQEINQEVKTQPDLLKQHLRQLANSIIVLNNINETITRLSQHPKQTVANVHESKNKTEAKKKPETKKKTKHEINDKQSLFPAINVSFIIAPLKSMVEAICNLSNGQLSLEDYAKETNRQNNRDQESPDINNPDADDLTDDLTDNNSDYSLIDHSENKVETRQNISGSTRKNTNKTSKTVSTRQQKMKQKNSKCTTADNIAPKVLTREQAFIQLKLLADFFARTEPHSPVSFQIERAIRWGHTSLSEMMTELLGDNEEACRRVEHLVGLKNLLPSDDD